VNTSDLAAVPADLPVLLVQVEHQELLVQAVHQALQA
jgi:hypothetical protein